MTDKNSDGFVPGQRVEWADMRRADLSRPKGSDRDASDAKEAPAEDAPIEIPDGWRDIHGAKIIALAKSLGSEAGTKDGAVSYIEAELERRDAD